MCSRGQRDPPGLATMTIMTLQDIKIAVPLALMISCTVVAVSLVNSVEWPLVVGWGVVPLIMILGMWHPPMRPAFARVVRK